MKAKRLARTLPPSVPRVFQWGELARGRIRPLPELVGGLDAAKVRQLACGHRRSFAVLDSGAVVGWTDGEPSQLLAESSGAVSIVAGLQHLLVLDRDGGVLGVGDGGAATGREGPLEAGSSEGLSSSVHTMKIGERVKGISSGYGHGVALGESGRVYAWGQNDSGQCGVRSEDELVGEPVARVEGLSEEFRAEKVFAGGDFSMALSKSGELKGWGLLPGNDNNIGEWKAVSLPLLPDGEHVEDVAASMNDLVVLSNKGGVWRLQEQIWTRIETGVARAVSVGVGFGAAIQADSEQLTLWGAGEGGRLADGNSQGAESQNPFVPGFFVARRVSSVVLGPTHGLVIMKD